MDNGQGTSIDAFINVHIIDFAKLKLNHSHNVSLGLFIFSSYHI